MNSRLYFISSIIYVLSGTGHIISDLGISLFLNPEDNGLYRDMSLYYLNVFGFKRSIHELMKGFSLTMGCMLLFFGMLNLLLLNIWKDQAATSPVLAIFNSIASLTVFILSVTYFHWPPIAGYFLSALIFFIIFIRSMKLNRIP